MPFPCDDGKMKAIFYDRLNKREVSSDQLMPTKLIEEQVVADTEGEAPCKLKLGHHEVYVKKVVVAELCYKTDDCPKYMNFDMDTTLSELVFLRLEE